jgi:hypothetical protein
MLWAANWLSILGKEKSFSFLLSVLTRTGSYPASYPMSIGDPVLGSEAAREWS